MNLRSFNAEGLEAAAAALAQIRAGLSDSLPEDLVENPEYSVELNVRFERPRVGALSTRFDLAVWLYQRLDGRIAEEALHRDEGMWSWMAFALFDLIAPADQNGHPQLVKDNAKYLLRRGDYRKAYRHLIAGPFLLLRVHSNELSILRPMLANPPQTPGDVYEQLASRKPIVTSSGAIQLVTRLYWDQERGAMRRGAAGKAAGSARRFAATLMQLDVTHDLVAASEDRLAALLPGEFRVALERHVS